MVPDLNRSLTSKVAHVLLIHTVARRTCTPYIDPRARATIHRGARRPRMTAPGMLDNLMSDAPSKIRLALLMQPSVSTTSHAPSPTACATAVEQQCVRLPDVGQHSACSTCSVCGTASCSVCGTACGLRSACSFHKHSSLLHPDAYGSHLLAQER